MVAVAAPENKPVGSRPDLGKRTQRAEVDSSKIIQIRATVDSVISSNPDLIHNSANIKTKVLNILDSASNK